MIKTLLKIIGQCYEGIGLGYFKTVNLAKWYFTKQNQPTEFGQVETNAMNTKFGTIIQQKF